MSNSKQKGYFSWRSAMLLVVITVMMLTGPLILPTLPQPPPVFLLFVPLVLLVLLFFLAFSPSTFPHNKADGVFSA